MRVRQSQSILLSMLFILHKNAASMFVDANRGDVLGERSLPSLLALLVELFQRHSSYFQQSIANDAAQAHLRENPHSWQRGLHSSVRVTIRENAVRGCG